MKPTIDINLNGMVYHIDDDAYQLLHDYLHKVEQHLGNSEDTKDIMFDIEARIAELFSDMQLHQHTQVVNLSMVQSVLSQLGTPESYCDEDETGNNPTPPSQSKVKKRFYRDPDNQLLGGVCSGIAAYLGWDAFWIRILVLVLTCFYGITIPIYLVVWMIAPAATTAAQRLEMEGEIASVENIKKKIEETKSMPQVSSASSTFRTVLGFLFRLTLGLFLLCVLLPVLAVLIAVLVSFFGVGIGFLATMPFFGDFHIFDVNGWWMALYIINVLFLVVIPVYVLICWLVKSRKNQRLTARFWWISGVLWLLCVTGVTVMSVRFLHKTDISEWNIFHNNFASSEQVTEVREVPSFDVVNISGAVEIKVRQDANQLLSVSSRSLEQVSTTVSNDTLYIQAVGPKDTEIDLSVPRLRGLLLRGAANIETESTLQTEVFSLELAGASEANLSLDVDTLYVRLDGASDLQMQGTAAWANLRIQGGSDISAYGLVTQTMDIHCKGACQAEVNCTENLYAHAYGASKIRYKGKPVIQEQVTAGASTIKAKF